MLGGRLNWTCPVIWVGLFAFCGRLYADTPAQFPNLPQSRSAKVQDAPRPNPPMTFHFGVMGQIARPGVYELNTPAPQLTELIRHAGGLTQKATNQIRIVRHGNAGQSMFFTPGLNFKLVAGDIVVADGPRESRLPQRLNRTPPSLSTIRTADYSESQPLETSKPFRQVALVGVLDRPVILPVPQTHANVPAILAYLGQAATLASTVKVVPIGGRPRVSPKAKTASPNFRVPTVLQFPMAFMQADRLPKFPDVYHIEDQPAVAPNPLPGERRTAENTGASPPLNVPLEAPTPIERFQRPLPHSVVVFPPPSAQGVSEPPLIAKVRDVENQIPDPKPIPSPLKSKESNSNLVAELASQSSTTEPTRASKAETSPWLYMGLILLVLAAAGTYAKLRWKLKRPDSNVAQSTKAQTPLEKESLPAQPIVSKKPLTSKSEAEPKLADEIGYDAGNWIQDDVLNSLVFNQIPVVEELAEPSPNKTASDKPESQKTYRIDPPEQNLGATAPKPIIVRRSQSPENPVLKPSRKIPAVEESREVSLESSLANPHTAKDTEEPTTQSSLLDRVLQQVNQPRAA